MRQRTELENQDTLTNPDFWDCECLNNFIHPKTHKGCPKCKTEQDEQPDSRQLEIRSKYAGFFCTCEEIDTNRKE